MKSNYPFLQRWKADEKSKKKPVNRTTIMVMGGAGLAGAQPPANMQFTGYGEDGQLQPDNPVEMVDTQQGQRLIHEGEVKVTYPDGTTAVVPADQMPQDKLRKLQEKGMQGFQAGGTFRPSPTPITNKIKAKKPETGLGGFPKPMPKVGAVADIKPVIGGMSPEIKKGIGGMSPVIGQGIGGMSPQIGEGILPTPPAKPVPQIPGLGQVSPSNVPAQPTPPIEGLAEGQAFPAQPFGAKAKGMGVAPPSPDVEQPLTEDELFYQQTLQKLKKLSEGESELDRRIREEERARFKGEETAGRGALEQQMSQLGLTGREALLERAMAGRGFAAQEAEVISNLRKGQADRAFAASMALPGATLAGMKFKLDKEQWDKMFELGKEKWDYGKKLDFINSLIQQGGADNFNKASDMLQDIFGQSVDFTNALNSENQSNFFSGMDIMSSSIASGLDWESTLKALEQGGLLDKMGMTESGLKSMFERMKLQSDPLYQTMQMADTWLEEGWIDQEEYDKYIALMQHMLTNPEGFDISDGYTVYDENGKEQGFFKTQDEANEFMKDHPDWTTEFTKNHIGPGAGGGPGTGTGPTENFDDFLYEVVPESEFNDDGDPFVTRKMWEDAGNPATWDDFIKNYGFGKYMNKKYGSNNLRLYSKENQSEILDYIKDGDEAVMKTFLAPEDSSINEIINMTEQTGEHALSRSEIAAHMGKFIEYADGKYGIAVRWKSGRTADGKAYQEVLIRDPDTGEEESYRRYNND